MGKGSKLAGLIKNTTTRPAVLSEDDGKDLDKGGDLKAAGDKESKAGAESGMTSAQDTSKQSANEVVVAEVKEVLPNKEEVKVVSEVKEQPREVEVVRERPLRGGEVEISAKLKKIMRKDDDLFYGKKTTNIAIIEDIAVEFNHIRDHARSKVKTSQGTMINNILYKFLLDNADEIERCTGYRPFKDKI